MKHDFVLCPLIYQNNGVGLTQQPINPKVNIRLQIFFFLFWTQIVKKVFEFIKLAIFLLEFFFAPKICWSINENARKLWNFFWNFSSYFQKLTSHSNFFFCYTGYVIHVWYKWGHLIIICQNLKLCSHET